MNIDPTCWLVDYQTPAERLSGAYREVTRALREKIAQEEAAITLLENSGYKVIRVDSLVTRS